MADFAFNLLTHSPERLNVISTRLGTGGNVGGVGGDVWTDKEVGKAVKIGPNSNHILCADGDEIEAIVDNIDSGPTNGGFTFGGVARGNRGLRMPAKVGTEQTGNLAVGDLVVAGAQAAVGTDEVALVKGGSPAVNKWRVINLKGSDGSAGSEIIIELC